jgi:hypothetical protein
VNRIHGLGYHAAIEQRINTNQADLAIVEQSRETGMDRKVMRSRKVRRIMLMRSRKVGRIMLMRSRKVGRIMLMILIIDIYLLYTRR